jgi:predicted aminopeptidase
LQATLGESRARNNADLAASATYHDLVPQLQSLLDEAGGDLAAFRVAAEALAAQRRP